MKLAALLLATLWLPATLHCQLESLGLDTLFACADQPTETAHTNGDTCSDDGCQSIESGQFATSKVRLDVAALPAFAIAAQFCLFELPAPAPAAEIVAIDQDTTLPLQRTWQFDRRAALPARAPDFIA
ncbi:MAG TPA: hypothetical protein VGD97_00265 [Lacunisphaera sp.]